MPKTILQTTTEERRTYHLRAAIERRQTIVDHTREERWWATQRLAREAAGVLRQQFAAGRVVLFGSAVRRQSFSTWSDVDLAVWGLPSERFYAAVAAVSRLSPAIDIDLVDADRCAPAVRTVIERDGVEL
jgi:predicted nucleotidyltransferase